MCCGAVNTPHHITPPGPRGLKACWLLSKTKLAGQPVPQTKRKKGQAHRVCCAARVRINHFGKFIVLYDGCRAEVGPGLILVAILVAILLSILLAFSIIESNIYSN